MRTETKLSEMLDAQKTIRLSKTMLTTANTAAKDLNITSNEWFRLAVAEKLRRDGNIV